MRLTAAFFALLVPCISTAADVHDATGVHAGLGVVLGHGDGTFAADLTNGGRMVVQSLSLDDEAVEAARKALRTRGVYGLAAADRITTLDPLPYADNLVNLLVVDRDALGARAPTDAEVARVLAPLGVAYVRVKGEWTKARKPMPKGLDGWTHFYHGPDGNPVSDDEHVGPPTGLQWIAGVQCMGAEPTTGYRLAGGRALYEWEPPRRDKKTSGSYLICRDAFSGVVLWTRANEVRLHKNRPVVLTDDRVYTHLEPTGPLVALDARTGETVRTYDDGGRPSKKVSGNRSDVNLVFHDGLLVQTAGSAAYALDAATGKLRWKHAEADGRFIDYPTVAAAAGQVFFTTGKTPRDAGRYPGADAREVLALDLKTGKLQWRKEMGRELSQLCSVEGALYAFNLAGFIGRPRDLFLARLDPKDGSEAWRINPGAKGQFLDFSIVGGKVYVMSLGLKVYDAATGKELAALPMPGNSRCEMSRASRNHLLMSFGNFIDLRKESLEVQRCEISRGSCGTGNTPGYGMLFYNPNRCQCFVSVRGYLAASREKVREPLPDAGRLEKAEARRVPGRVGAWPAADEWPIYLGNPARGGATATPVPAEMRPLWEAKVEAPPAAKAGPVIDGLARSSHFNGPVTAPVIAGGSVFVAVPERHRVEALDAKTGKPRWAFTAGGRVDTPPTVYDGLCLFGAHDGRAYALDAATGKLVWRFLAAPYERRMVAHDQVESSWPLFGSVAVADGVAVVAAGRHPETNGGIFAYGLDPHTGKMLWKRHVHHERAPGPLGKKVADGGVTTRPYGYNANNVQNEVLISDGKRVAMTGLILDAKTGEVANAAWPKKRNDRPQGLPEHPMPFYLDLGFRPPYRDQRLESYDGPGQDHGAWTYRLGKLEVHGELIAFDARRVVAAKVSDVDWAMWDLTAELPAAGGKGRKHSSHAPGWSAARGSVKGMVPRAVLLAGDRLVVGFSGEGRGLVRVVATKDGSLLGETRLDAGVTQAGLAAAGGRLFVTGEDGVVRCLGG